LYVRSRFPRPACARNDGRRENGRDDKQDSEGGRTEKEREEDRVEESERKEKKEREGEKEGEGHFKHCPLVRKLNFESRTDH